MPQSATKVQSPSGKSGGRESCAASSVDCWFVAGILKAVRVGGAEGDLSLLPSSGAVLFFSVGSWSAVASAVVCGWAASSRVSVGASVVCSGTSPVQQYAAILKAKAAHATAAAATMQ